MIKKLVVIGKLTILLAGDLYVCAANRKKARHGKVTTNKDLMQKSREVEKIKRRNKNIGAEHSETTLMSLIVPYFLGNLGGLCFCLSNEGFQPRDISVVCTGAGFVCTLCTHIVCNCKKKKNR